MFWMNKRNECPAEETLNSEIQSTKDLLTQKIDTLNDSIDKGFANAESTQKQSSEKTQTYIDKMDALIFGNGEEGLKTRVALQESKQKTLKTDIDKIGDSGRQSEAKVHKRIDDALKEVEKVGRETLVNSTKIYVFCGIIALLATLVSIFVPMAIGTELTQTRQIDDFLLYANHSEESRICQIIFNCTTKDLKEPILDVFTVRNCLQCTVCKKCIDKYLRKILEDISKVWHREFKTYRMNIFNCKKKLLYVIDSKGNFKKFSPQSKRKTA